MHEGCAEALCHCVHLLNVILLCAQAAMYEEQDIARKNSIVEEDTSAARDFFGDVNVRPAAAPPARPEEQSNPVE